MINSLMLINRRASHGDCDDLFLTLHYSLGVASRPRRLFCEYPQSTGIDGDFADYFVNLFHYTPTIRFLVITGQPPV
jgi:hypothetical protein